MFLDIIVVQKKNQPKVEVLLSKNISVRKFAKRARKERGYNRPDANNPLEFSINGSEIQ